MNTNQDYIVRCDRAGVFFGKIKERNAMDIERYGDCKVVSITSDRGREEQLRMKGAKL